MKRNREVYGIPLQIVTYEDLYGWSMDRIVRAIGKKSNCEPRRVLHRHRRVRSLSTSCSSSWFLVRRHVLRCISSPGAGSWRRVAARRPHRDGPQRGRHRGDGADEPPAWRRVASVEMRGDHHRYLGRVLLPLLPSRIALSVVYRCVDAGSEGEMPRCKPFKFTYEKEIVMYAHFKKLDYFSTECIYSPNAYRGFAREFLKDLEVCTQRQGARLPAPSLTHPRLARCSAFGLRLSLTSSYQRSAFVWSTSPCELAVPSVRQQQLVAAHLRRVCVVHACVQQSGAAQLRPLRLHIQQPDLQGMRAAGGSCKGSSTRRRRRVGVPSGRGHVACTRSVNSRYPQCHWCTT